MQLVRAEPVPAADPRPNGIEAAIREKRLRAL